MRPGRAGADGSSAARPEIAVLMPETPSIMHWHRPRPQRAAHDSQHVLGMTRVLTGICLALAGLSLSAHAMGSARDLADDCRTLVGAKTGAGKQIRIPFTKKALVCWGYMQAMQDLSVLADEDGRRIMGACPPERTTLLKLIQAFVSYAHSHTDELPNNAALAVTRALQEAFPCGANGTGFRGPSTRRRRMPSYGPAISESAPAAKAGISEFQGEDR
jgi:hypothetical protein